VGCESTPRDSLAAVVQGSDIAHEQTWDFVAGACQDFDVTLTEGLTLRQNP
jgi:hypothetical protein